MNRAILAWLMIGWLGACLPGVAQAGVPEVRITHPAGGYTSQRVLQVDGWVRGEVGGAHLVVNGSERPLQLPAPDEDGTMPFSVTLLVAPGYNTILVEATNDHGTGRDVVSFFANVPSLNLSVVLTWDTPGTDVDLHVIDPSGEECDYTHKQTAAGGRLDVDDTDGYGPEIFTLANALEGTYKIVVKYFSDHGFAQTLATVDVILYEGTAAEKRYRFETMLTRTGSTYEVGEFRVSPVQP